MNKAVSSQEVVDVFFEAMDILDSDFRAELAQFRTEVSAQTNSINDLMEVSGQLDISIDTVYEDLFDVSNSIQQLSTLISEVQENQLILQNALNQPR